MLRTMMFVAAGLLAGPALAQDPGVSVDDGERISVVGGCHDCHSPGYEMEGKIDPATALKGSQSGFQGPWGTTYPVNIRLIAADKTEDQWVEYMKTLKARPPMPWFNVHRMTDTELRSFYQYVKSLGEPGDPAPDYVPPGQEPKFPYVVLAPPVMPKG